VILAQQRLNRSGFMGIFAAEQQKSRLMGGLLEIRGN